MKYSRYNGKIGYCDNIYLKGLESLSGGHYVYIRNVDDKGYCYVNVITSLEDKNRRYNLTRLKQVKQGNIYAIPVFDTNLKLWSGISHGIKKVSLSHIQDIGKRAIKDRHKFYIGKFME